MSRVREVKSEDSDIALRHVFNTRYPGQQDADAAFRRVSDHAQGLLRRHIPAQMTVKMLLNPLELQPDCKTRWLDRSRSSPNICSCTDSGNFSLQVLAPLCAAAPGFAAAFAQWL